VVRLGVKLGHDPTLTRTQWRRETNRWIQRSHEYTLVPSLRPSGVIPEHLPRRVVNVHDRLNNLRKLSGILLDAGSKDDYNVHWSHRLLSHYLDEAGIADEQRENAGNHGGRANESYQMALRWPSQVLHRDVT
jgi:hypothetical protein